MPAVRELLVRWGFEVDDRKLAALETSIGDVATAAKAAGAVVAGAATTLFGLAEGARRTIDDLDEMAQSVGVNTQFFAEFTAAARLGGASTEDVAAATARFQRAAVEAREGNVELRKSFETLGISQQDLARLPTEVLLTRLADGMKGIEDPAKRVALAQELLGRGGRKLIPSLVGGADELARLGAEAREFGLVPGPEAIEAANKMELALARARGVIAGVGLQIGTALMPVVSDIAQRFAMWAKENRELILSRVEEFVRVLTIVVREAWEATTAVVSALQSFVRWVRETGEGAFFARTAVALLVGAMSASLVLQFVGALQGLRAAVLAVNAAIALNPIGALLTLLGVMIALWVANWSEIREVTLFVWEEIKDAGRAAVRAFQDAWAGVAGWFESNVVDPLVRRWARFTGTIGQVADFFGIGGGGQSPGRPGSPESRLTPLPTSTGVAAGARGAPSQSVNVRSSIVVNVPAGMGAAQQTELESRLRRAAREEIARGVREALAEMP